MINFRAEVNVPHCSNLPRKISEIDAGTPKIIVPVNPEIWVNDLEKTVKESSEMYFSFSSTVCPSTVAVAIGPEMKHSASVDLEKNQNLLGFIADAATLRRLRAVIDLAIEACNDHS